MLRYAIKSQEGHPLEAPKQLFDEKISVPDPPQRGVIKVITAGFPWCVDLWCVGSTTDTLGDSQTHSTMNMFKDADDIKSNLILTTLSFLDYYRPALAFFENVPGFLNYSLNATQVDRHRTEGGLEMGGLKLLVKALIDMGFVADVISSYFRLIACLVFTPPVIKYATVSFKRVTTELHKDVYGFSSLQQKKVRHYPNCHNQPMHSRLLTYYKSNIRSRTIGRRIPSVPSVQLKGRLRIRSLLSNLLLETFHVSIGTS